MRGSLDMCVSGLEGGMRLPDSWGRHLRSLVHFGLQGPREVVHICFCLMTIGRLWLYLSLVSLVTSSSCVVVASITSLTPKNMELRDALTRPGLLPRSPPAICTTSSIFWNFSR